MDTTFDGITAESTIAIYIAILLAPAFLGIIAGCTDDPRRTRTSTVLCSISCIIGVLCYPMWCLCPDVTVTFPIGSFLGDYIVHIDQLSAVFVSFSSAVFLMVVLHASGSGHEYGSGFMALACALHTFCMLCMVAGSVVLLLVAWEIVSMVTFLMARSKEEISRWRFFAITHIGGLILMVALGYLWYVAGTGDVGQWHDLGERLGDMAPFIVLSLFVGFGTKLGMIPFHAWIPDMYANSPTHTTVLLTTVCSNAAVLLLFKSVFVWIGLDADLMIVGIILCVLAAATVLWGAMESMVQTEPKRILSYSSMENMALVTMCFALAVIFSSDGLPALTMLVLMAGLLHTLNHGVFKSLMLLTVDSVEEVTGERKIDRLGGLAKVLPGLSLVALIGVMSLAAIPPMNGFVSEWLMLQSLLGTDAVASDMRVAMPLLIALMGVSGMIVATAYARLYGFMFLGRPRSKGASEPSAMSKTSILPLAVLAMMCIAMGILSFPLMDAMSSGMGALTGIEQSYKDGMSGTMMPLTLGILLAGTVTILFVMTRIFRRGRRIDDTWGCGGTLDERMQYSSEGFSQPIVRVFHPIYQDVSEKKGDTYTTSFVEPFVKYIYGPLGALLTYISNQITRIQTGNIQSYLGYILITLVVTLLAVRLI